LVSRQLYVGPTAHDEETSCFIDCLFGHED